MGEVSLGFPMSICLLGLGPWHRFPWQEEGVVSLEHSFEPGCVWEGRAALCSAQRALESPRLLYISWAAFQAVPGTRLRCSGPRASPEARKKR